MDLIIYLNKRVLVILTNGFSYEGVVISVDDNSLTMIDKYNSHVAIKEEKISTIKELK